MPSDPVAITCTPPQDRSSLSTLPNTTPSSSFSVSPQTPFYPPPGHPAAANTSVPVTTGAGNSFFKWAASTLAKSPSAMSPPLPSPSINQQKGFDIPVMADDHEHETHDSFEFGDFNDLKSRSWTGGRRAASMSAPKSSGVTSMLRGFGATDPVQTQAAQGQAQAKTQPQGQLVAENAARGQGVLRRLSLSGAGYRVSLLVNLRDN